MPHGIGFAVSHGGSSVGHGSTSGRSGGSDKDGETCCFLIFLLPDCAGLAGRFHPCNTFNGVELYFKNQYLVSILRGIHTWCPTTPSSVLAS